VRAVLQKRLADNIEGFCRKHILTVWLDKGLSFNVMKIMKPYSLESLLSIPSTKMEPSLGTLSYKIPEFKAWSLNQLFNQSMNIRMSRAWYWVEWVLTSFGKYYDEFSIHKVSFFVPPFMTLWAFGLCRLGSKYLITLKHHNYEVYFRDTVSPLMRSLEIWHFTNLAIINWPDFFCFKRVWNVC